MSRASRRGKKDSRRGRKPNGWLRAIRRIIVRTTAGGVLFLLLLILALRWLPASTSAFMMTRHAENLSSPPARPLDYQWVSGRRIPAHMALAVVAAEDQNFPHHWGFDLKAIGQAVRHNRRGRSIRGASTISQQVAKNLFLWSGRGYGRKALEAGLTVCIELLWPKERILEMYLNIAEFGDNTYGVSAAARRFFGKKPEALTRHEAAVLAAVLPSPRRLSAANPSPYVLRRADWIQRQMHQLGPGHVEWP